MTPGKDFEDRLTKRIKERPDCFVERLRDSHAPLFDAKRKPQTEGSRFAVPSPYDFRVIMRASGRGEGSRGHFYVYALECKSTTAKRFAFSMVKENQRKGLLAMPDGVVAAVVVEMRSFNRCFVLPIGQLLSLADNDDGRKSMSLSDLVHFAIELPVDRRPRETRIYYDVSPLLNEGESP